MVAKVRSLILPALLVLGLPWSSTAAVAQEDEWRPAKSAVVMIDGTLGGVPTSGAGIVFGHGSDRIYVVTARHVVWDRDTAASQVKVRFHFLPGEEYDARVLADSDVELDLAVLSVGGVAASGIPAQSIALGVLGRPGQLRRGASLYPIGYPEGRRWSMPIRPDGFDTMTGSRIIFQTSVIRPGHSGGGLFDACKNLVGILMLSSPPDGEALSIDPALAWLRTLSYPIGLQVSERTGCREGGEVPDPPQTCSLRISSTPSGAQVHLDGVLRGTTPVSLTLERGKSFALGIEKEGHEPYEAAIDCASGSVTARLKELTGDIQIRYLGDWYACNLQLTIEIGGKRFRPTGSMYTVRDVPLGEADYEIDGMITCPMAGACNASGSGTIEIRDGATYDVSWQNTAYAQCTIMLAGP